LFRENLVEIFLSKDQVNLLYNVNVYNTSFDDYLEREKKVQWIYSKIN